MKIIYVKCYGYASIMIKTISLKDVTYKGKKYKFITPLKVRFEEFFLMDFKSKAWEMYIAETLDGFTRKEPVVDFEKEARNYIKKVFDDFLTKPDEELHNNDDILYKHHWISLFKEPKNKK